jgi:serine/threonine-protein kinase
MTQSDWVGRTLGDRYVVDDVLGTGGMSSVYKATDPNLKRVVAIKLIHPHLSGNPDFVVRFKEEAAAVAQLRHPNIVQVFDFNNDGDTYYMVMEFLPGETLHARLARLDSAHRRLPIAEAAKFAAEVCDAADYAHKRGMVHRDIKPANVILDVHAQAILMDFGIAKIVGGQHHTATGATLGTAVYMSPEQIRGDQVDGRADIYSIGVMLFEMLSGRPPYEADSAMTLMMMHLNDPVPDLQQLRPDTPPDLVAVIRKALAKNRDERFQSAAEMATFLRKIAAGGLSTAEMQSLRVMAAPVASFAGSQDPTTALHRQSPAGQSGAAVSSASAASTKRTFSPVMIAGAAGALVSLCILAIAIGAVFLGGNDSAAGAGPDATDTPIAEAGNPTSTATAVAAVASPTAGPAPTATTEQVAPTQPPAPTQVPTEPPAATVAPIATYAPTATLPPPTETSAPTPIPTNTQPPGPYARIKQITLQGNSYVVDYETIGFTESQAGWHTHFFFNTVPPEQAGIPGHGPWIAYYGPIPFTQYTVGDRPGGATLMCIRVANSDHSLYYTPSDNVDTGNCAYLP